MYRVNGRISKQLPFFCALFYSFILQVYFGWCLPADLDLEEMAQDFVLQSKKIEIPGYPNAFNPSIIRWQGNLLLSFRDIPDPRQSFNSNIGVIWLDDNCNPVGKPQILETQNFNSSIPSRAEDARLIADGERLLLVYSDCKEEKISKGGFRLYVAELLFDGSKFIVLQNECLSRFEGESQQRREKNWVPFFYKGELMLAYSLAPHLIFRYLQGMGKCETIALTQSEFQWNWGDLRGGTTGLEVDGQYLSFFHSSMDMPTLHSNGVVVSHYFMGAYTFALHPPFEITRVSPEPIIGKNFYKGPVYKPYWKPVRVVFPCGFIFDEQFIWVAYGRQDHESWIVKLDKEGLLKSLIPTK